MNTPIDIDSEIADIAFYKAHEDQERRPDIATWRIYERVAWLLSRGLDPAFNPLCQDKCTLEWNGDTLRCTKCGLNCT